MKQKRYKSYSYFLNTFCKIPAFWGVGKWKRKRFDLNSEPDRCVAQIRLSVQIAHERPNRSEDTGDCSPLR